MALRALVFLCDFAVLSIEVRFARKYSRPGAALFYRERPTTRLVAVLSLLIGPRFKMSGSVDLGRLRPLETATEGFFFINLLMPWLSDLEIPPETILGEVALLINF